MKKNYSITIGWLYPDLMSTYGDRGNIIAFQKRCLWRGIETKLIPIDSSLGSEQINEIDFIFGGGSQDLEQELVMRDLKGKKAEALKIKIEQNTPALFVCGSPQLMGHYYEPAVGTRIEGLGIFDMVSVHPGPDALRCIGNTVGAVLWNNLNTAEYDELIVGFENHGGRTKLGKNAKPFARVVKGYGNNGIDKTEGVVYKNAIGCYYHGPFLPKNPHVSDFIIGRTIEVKYKEKIQLLPLHDVLENTARKTLFERFGV